MRTDMLGGHEDPTISLEHGHLLRSDTDSHHSIFLNNEAQHSQCHQAHIKPNGYYQHCKYCSRMRYRSAGASTRTHCGGRPAASHTRTDNIYTIPAQSAAISFYIIFCRY